MVTDEADWRRFVAAVGAPAWAGDRRFATDAARRANAAELDRLIETWTRERTPEEVMECLQAAGVAAGVVADARDLAAFTINAVERNFTGTYNLVSNVNGFKFGELVDASIESANRRAGPADPPRVTWLPADFLAAQEVAPWSEMPVWLPASGEEAAFAGTSNAAAVAKGLTITPIAKTVDDTMAWHLARPAEEREKLKAGIAPDKEAKVLASWKAKAAGG